MAADVLADAVEDFRIVYFIMAGPPPHPDPVDWARAVVDADQRVADAARAYRASKMRK